MYIFTLVGIIRDSIILLFIHSKKTLEEFYYQIYSYYIQNKTYKTRVDFQKLKQTIKITQVQKKK